MNKTSSFSVKVRLSNSQLIDGFFTLSPSLEGRTIIRFNDIEDDIIDDDTHIFSAFCRIRVLLESKGKLLLCKGCRKDVYPSGRLLKTKFAYQLTMGRRVDHQHDEIMIFDREDDERSLGNVKEQHDYFMNWLDSIKNIPY